MKKPILIMGATDYTSVFIDSFEANPSYKFVGCIENLNPLRCEEKVLGLPIYWDNNIDSMFLTHDLICSLATTKRFNWIKDLERRGASFTSISHPSNTISRRSSIGSGSSIDAVSVVAGFTAIGDHVRIGRRVSIGHHTKISNFCTIHPGAIISGHCTIGQQVTIGAGAIILEKINIGDNSVVGAGAVVRDNVPENSLVAGNPARIIKSDYGPI